MDAKNKGQNVSDSCTTGSSSVQCVGQSGSTMTFTSPSGPQTDDTANLAVFYLDWTPTSTSSSSDNTMVNNNKDQFNFVLNEVIVPILFGVITFVGVIGNCLVIYVILSKERMRTVTNLLLLNLAAADLLFVLFIPSVTAYQFATLRWPFGDAACKLMHYIVNVSAYVTVYTLVLVTILRYMTIVHNATTVQLRTRKKVVILIVLLWAAILAANAPILWSYSVKNSDCQHESTEVAQQIFTTLFVFSYLLPLAVIGVLSICILRHIAKHRSQVLGTKTKYVCEVLGSRETRYT